VTGTNGKTTTTSLLAAILRHAGRPTGVIGTLTGRHTTPEAPELQRLLAEFRDAGMSSVVMEVSSHALELHRVAGWRFGVCVFTNLGRDHLDLHGTIERYFAAKAMLFESTRCAAAVVNLDDVHEIGRASCRERVEISVGLEFRRVLFRSISTSTNPSSGTSPPRRCCSSRHAAQQQW